MLLSAENESQALEQLHQNGCTDGLPVVIPTPERVADMIARVDFDAALSLGEMGPKQGSATVEKVAAAAVMAGCLADHFPVVVAAVEAICDKEFDLTEVVQTTHCVTPTIVVNGPARIECGPIESAAGILGPGNRAGASIGRALSLAMINIGGRQPGVTDMAVFSNPGKFTACFAEAEELSPFEPYHVSLGYDADQSLVTVIGTEAPHSLIMEPQGDVDNDALRLIKTVASVIANPGSNHLYTAGTGSVLVVLNPEHASILARAGYDRPGICDAICNHATISRDYAETLYAGLNMEQSTDKHRLRAVNDPDQIMMIVAGGLGSYSMVLPTWAGYAPNDNRPVSKVVEVFPHCDLPFN